MDEKKDFSEEITEDPEEVSPEGNPEEKPEDEPEQENPEEENSVEKPEKDGPEESSREIDLPTAEQLSSEAERIRYKKNYLKMLYNTIASLIVVAAVAVLISTLFLPVFRVTGTSMTPTMQNDDLVICRKRSDFKCGDIVAFYFNNKILLKRVIGTAGDVIDISEDGTVFVNGEAIDEPYVSEKAFGECDIDLPYQVPDNRIFVMGDHRSVSVDSRSTSVGCIADEYIIGKVILRLWPLSSFGPVEE